MFVSFFKNFFNAILGLFSFSRKPKGTSDDIERTYIKYRSVHPNDDYEDETDMEVCNPELLTMHKIDIKDKHGCLRFRLQYMPKREILNVTILDAQDLPAMDKDGKSDPYVEVSIICTQISLNYFDIQPNFKI